MLKPSMYNIDPVTNTVTKELLPNSGCNGFKLDKNHTFVVNMFDDIDKYSKVSDQYQPPAPKEFKLQVRARACLPVPAACCMLAPRTPERMHGQECLRQLSRSLSQLRTWHSSSWLWVSLMRPQMTGAESGLSKALDDAVKGSLQQLLLADLLSLHT